ncbi:Zn(II)2Cys6 transcription factor [Aspergillus undulatus]|uniref:Zn(II)2Cys6 transcription factor n=1 Tax=Aspergillus undulatus TaxID=1810928 RepID=UPI003CCCD58F
MDLDGNSAGSAFTPQLSYGHLASPAEGASKNRRKDPKVSRACDTCKAKKIRCSGTLPCNTCSRRKLTCTFATRYGRGKPPTPQSSTTDRQIEGNENESLSERVSHGYPVPPSLASTDRYEERATPGANSQLVIEGQYVGTTSNLTFLHRAWNKLSTQASRSSFLGPNVSETDQLLASAGDIPFHRDESAAGVFPGDNNARKLLSFYFDMCVATHRILHRQTVEGWLETTLRNRAHGQPVSQAVGNARLAIMFSIFAIATFRKHRLQSESSDGNEHMGLAESDPVFCAAVALTDSETGFPRLESAQARLLQVLYLLQTTRMNNAWYSFGNAYQIISSLGLHRRQPRKANVSLPAHLDYITCQCGKRVFWTAYIIDKYLSVVFGRPRLMHDDEIDEDFPDPVNDEDMGPHGASTEDPREECHIISLVSHAKIARIIARISGEVYCVRGRRDVDQLAAANRSIEELNLWHEQLPSYLGTVKPSTLIPSFRREASALRLAYLHALIHATRPFLLNNDSNDALTPALEDKAAECLDSARKVLEIITSMASDAHLFHSLWWTQYVLFCALAVVYVREIQQRPTISVREDQHSQQSLLELAESCRSSLLQGHSAAPLGHRYGIILEELRSEAQQRASRRCATSINRTDIPQNSMNGPNEQQALEQAMGFSDLHPSPGMLDGWQPADWLDLDSSAFHSLPDVFDPLI